MAHLPDMLERITDDLIVDRRVARAFDELALDTNDLGYDIWGFHPRHAKIYYSIGYQIYRYFRPRVTGLERMPTGRVLLVGNHSGQLPFDGLVVSVATLLEARPPRLCRGMAERWFSELPFLNKAFARSGTVLGDPTNARNLLEADNAVLVFPEGARGSGKTWDHRYRLVSFGRGFMRLALETGTPIFPFAVIGGEESIVSLHNVKPLAKLLRMPYFPVPALLPVLGLAAYAPLPVRFHVHFGEVMRFTGRHDDEDEVIDEKVKKVTDAIQGMIDQGLSRRTSVFA